MNSCILKDYTGSQEAPQTLHENRMFRVLFNGQFHYVEFLRHPSSAIIVPRFTNGDFLLVRLPRAPIFGLSLEFPRGRAELFEPSSGTASRELREETGYAIPAADLAFLGEVGPDTATLNERNNVFLARIPDNAEQGSYDTQEIDSLLRVSEEEFKRFVCAGAILDAQTLAAFTLLACQAGG
jgi:8-oxo-dGTP pyrophosphatase MutT (NUDIX family)